jgi:hypothetical protein
VNTDKAAMPYVHLLSVRAGGFRVSGRPARPPGTLGARVPGVVRLFSLLTDRELSCEKNVVKSQAGLGQRYCRWRPV